MTESAGAYGGWFEQKSLVKPQPTREELLALSDQDLIDKDFKLYLQRNEYRRKCQKLYSGLSVMNCAMENAIAIRVNDPKIGEGLILRETFEDKKDVDNDTLTLHAFLMTPTAIYKIRNLTPTALGKAERASPEFRLSRLALVSDEIWASDILIDDKRSDADLLDRAIKRSVDSSRKKVGPQEYAANLVRFN